MYIAITGSKNNKDVYIYQSFRKEDGKSSSRIYKKLGKFNDLIAQFDGDKDMMLAWAKNEARKDYTAVFIKMQEIFLYRSNISYDTIAIQSASRSG